MRRDPIVEEVRRNREAIAHEHGNDLEAIATAFQREDAGSGTATVSFPPRRIRSLQRKNPARLNGPTSEWSRGAPERGSARLIRSV